MAAPENAECAAAIGAVIAEANDAVIHAQTLLNESAAENDHLTKCNEKLEGSINALAEECLLQRRFIAGLQKVIKAHKNAMRVVGEKLVRPHGAAGKRRR